MDVAAQVQADATAGRMHSQYRLRFSAQDFDSDGANDYAVFTRLSRSGVGALLVEYPGYGRSGGKPTQSSITETIVAAYDFAVDQTGVDRDAVVAYGRSLGAVNLAFQFSPSAGAETHLISHGRSRPSASHVPAQRSVPGA